MRVVIQRVTFASVEVDGQIVSKIGPGLLCLVGVQSTDTDREADLICRKMLKCRAFHNKETGRPWDVDIVGLGGEILLVSQFTLYGRLKKPKPDYSRAMGPEQAKDFYTQFVKRVRNAYVPERVKDGVFGAMMSVKLENDGPVTYILDSADFFGNGQGSVSGADSSVDDSSS